MTVRRGGFTLVEFMVVVVLGGVVVGAVYQSLIAQQRTYQVSGAMIQDQETLRAAVGILETELREVGARGGAARGGSDILVAERDSVSFRAQRKLGVICYPHPSERWAYAAAVGDRFSPGDSVLIHVSANDVWERAIVESVQSAAPSDCGGSPELVTLASGLVQRVKFANHTLAGVEVGSPFRSMRTVTYGLYEFPDRGWALGRHAPGEAPKYVVGRLAGPGDGLVLEYLSPDGTAAADTAQIGSIRITVTTRPQLPGVSPEQVVSTVYLRN